MRPMPVPAGQAALERGRHSEHDRRVVQRPVGDDVGELVRVVHDAQVVRLAVDVVDPAVAQAQVVPELVHEGPRLLGSAPHASGVAGDRGVRRRPAPQRHHEVVAEQLGAAGGRVGGRGRCRGLVVDEEPVVEGKALGVEHAGVGGAARSGGPEPSRS